MRKKTIAFILMLVLFITSIPIAATPNNIRELQEQQQDIASQIRVTLNSLIGTRAEMSSVMQEIYDLDNALIVISAQLIETSDLILNLLDSIETIENELASAQQDLENQMEAFRGRLRMLHEHGQVGLWEVVFQATGIRDFLLRVDQMNAIAAQDQRIIDDLEATEARIVSNLADLEIQVALLERLQAQQEAQQTELDAQLEERARILEALEANEESYQALLESQQADEARIQAAIEEAQRQEQARLAALAAEARAREQANLRDVAALQGQFLWPIPSVGLGNITSRFGARVNPITRRNETHWGIDIRATTGTPIVAADAGTVITSGWMGGFGQTVIIYHGNGVSTLYAHNSQNLVTVGQRVARGERIALVGSTGMSTGPHLHFEVRINGQPTNPNPFLGI